MKFTTTFYKHQGKENDKEAKDIGQENRGLLKMETAWNELVNDCR
jgi:hypothetical protein